MIDVPPGKFELDAVLDELLEQEQEAARQEARGGVVLDKKGKPARKPLPGPSPEMVATARRIRARRRRLGRDGFSTRKMAIPKGKPR